MTATATISKEAAATELLRRRKARRSLIPFSQFTYAQFEPNWHHELIANTLEQAFRTATDTLSQGEAPLRNVIICVPPRHGKSELASVRFPAWALGNDPQLQIIHASYAYSLSRTFSGACRDCMSAEPYQTLWPCRFTRDGDEQWMLEGKQNGRPNWISAGVGGGISGQGANIFIVDDPVKNKEEADSLTMREKVWGWWVSTARTRMQPKGVKIVILTRWHEDDLAGRLLKQAEADPSTDQWKVVLIPAVNNQVEGIVDGLPVYDALWPAKYDKYWLAATKATDISVWNALYQQRPRAREGNIIKSKWFKFWQRPGQDLGPVTVHTAEGPLAIQPVTLPIKFDEQLQSWDMAFKDTAASAYVVGQAWGRKAADKFLLDQTRERMSFTLSKHAVEKMRAEWPETFTILIEDKANGPAIINSLNHDISGIVPVEPDGSKESRLEAVGPEFESGNVYFPHPSLCPWVHGLMDELMAAPNGEFWDQCDATSQALNRMRSTGGGWFEYLRQEHQKGRTAELKLMREDATDRLIAEGILVPSPEQVHQKMIAMFGEDRVNGRGE